MIENEEDLSIFEDDLNNENNGGTDLLPFSLEGDENENDDEHEHDDFEIKSFEGNGEDYDNDQPIIPSYKENALINDILALKGIKDKTIQFENEEGEIENVNFYDLPKNEQLNIINSSEKDIDFGLEEDETNAINFLRENGVTFEEAIDYFKREAIQEYINAQNIAGIEVDQYTDEQLFAIDLKARYENLTDDEIAIEVEKQLEHPDLFKKKVDKLRTDYKEIEVTQLQAAQQQQELIDEQRYNDLQASLVSVATSVQDIGGLDIDNEDKEEILSYILDKDMNGVSQFIKSLDSPDKLFELAWYATKGKEAFNILHDYYKKQIDITRKSSYDKGRDEALGKVDTTRKTFIRDQPKQSNGTKFKDIMDFDHD